MAQTHSSKAVSFQGFENLRPSIERRSVVLRGQMKFKNHQWSIGMEAKAYWHETKEQDGISRMTRS